MFHRIAGGHMKDVVVIGAGKIGACVAGLLASTGDYQVTLADRSVEVLGSLDHAPRNVRVSFDLFLNSIRAARVLRCVPWSGLLLD
jgi:2-polyprenyl-6-methoxyphenol hydroxylase-like FAD-dependent oxidoreductase